ncbi:MAG: hypothetical protein R6W77_14370 [Trueperaceae bacterium]
MRKLVILTFAFVLSLGMAATAFASPGEHTGSEYGQHHADHAQTKGGFTGTMNPGVVHRGFAGWHQHMQDMQD